MKELSTFYQICVYITITMVLFTLAVNFVSAMNIFQTGIDVGKDVSGNSSNIFSSFTDVSSEGYTGMNAIWNLLLGSAIGLAAGAFLGLLMHSTVFMGIGLFSGVFWSSYINTIGIINVNNWLMTYPLSLFVVLGTVGMMFIFAGAIIGMLSGSG